MNQSATVEIENASPAARLRLRTGVILALVALVVTALALEGATRLVFNRQGMHFGIEMWKYARTLKRRSDDPNLGHEHIPGGQAVLMGVPVEISSQGLRDREFAIPKPAGVYRTLVLGDSMTFGWGAKFDDTYAKVLERKLNEETRDGLRFEVVNSGVGNYNTVQETTWLDRRGWHFEPDLVLLAFYVNDAEPTPVERQSWLAQRSQFYVFASSTGIAVGRMLGFTPTFDAYYRGLYYDDAPGWQACQAALGQLVDACREREIKVRWLLIPELHFPGGKYPFGEVHAAVTALAERDGVPALDLQDAFAGIPPRELWVSPGDAHPNALAHERIAERLLAWLEADPPWAAPATSRTAPSAAPQTAPQPAASSS